MTDAHTRFVSASARGSAAIRFASPAVMPFSTWAEKPPMKSIPTASAAASSVRAIRTKSSALAAPAIQATDVTAMRLLMIGTPNSWPISRLTRVRSAALVVILR